jgi:hypothetical protein
MLKVVISGLQVNEKIITGGMTIGEDNWSNGLILGLIFKGPACILGHGSGTSLPTVDFKTRRASHHVTLVRDRRIGFVSTKSMSVNSRRMTV